MPPEEAIKELVGPPAENEEVTPEKPDDNLTKLFLSNKHTPKVRNSSQYRKRGCYYTFFIENSS